MIKKQKIAVLAALVYTSLMAVGMLTVGQIVGSTYGDPEMAKTLIYFEMVMTIFALGIYLKYFKGASFKKTNRKMRKTALFTLAIMLLIEVLMLGILFFQTDLEGKDTALIALIFVTTIFVGLSEELIYRGIVLPAFLENKSKFQAILISSLFFSFLHAVNIFAGVGVAGMFTQLLLTFFVGITLACIAVELGNLLPLIVFHTFWDFLLFTETVAGADYGILPVIQVPFEIIMGMVLLFLIKKDKVEV